MDVPIPLIPIALLLGSLFAGLFLVVVREGQLEDLGDPAVRVPKDDD